MVGGGGGGGGGGRGGSSRPFAPPYGASPAFIEATLVYMVEGTRQAEIKINGISNLCVVMTFHFCS